MKKEITSNNKNSIPFVIENEYPNFIDFLKNEKYKIYQEIIKSFEEIVKTNDSKKLIIVAKVEDVMFDSTFDISKKNIKLLSETVNSYFESIEDYESCDRIYKLCLEIKRINR